MCKFSYVEDAGHEGPTELSDAEASLSRSSCGQPVGPWQETPTGYRFYAAAAYRGNHATPIMGIRLAITPAGRCKGFSVASRQSPQRYGEFRRGNEKNLRFVLRHSRRTCRIPPERALLMVQSAASLQRFASGSDSANAYVVHC